MQEDANATHPEDANATHPCERVFGSCASGDDCPFKDAPRAACVAFLKGRCRFGERCREPHMASSKGKFISALHPCIRIYGSCRYGEQCEYANMSSDTCIKFLKGRCTFGDRCKEQHPNAFAASMQQAMMGGMGGMPTMPMMPFGMPFGFPMPMAAGGGVLRGGKRQRDMDDEGSWKKQQVGMDGMQMMNNYFMNMGGGQFHPCVRIYGNCRDGPSCQYASFPFGACLQFLRGHCKFGETCRELHVQTPAARQKKVVGAKHPCERIYGFCQDGERCRYADFPSESCLMFLKGKCKFGNTCRELHTREPGNEGTQEQQ